MENVVLRVARSADAAAIANIFAHYVEHTTISFHDTPPTIASWTGQLEQHGGRYPWIVAVDADDVVGFAYATEHLPRAAYRWSVNTTIYLRDGLQRRGVGRTLYQGLLASLRGLGIANAYAGITLPNAPSEGLHRAVGFTLVGIYDAVGFKHGAWRDVAWYRNRLASLETPAEPRAFQDASAAELARWLSPP
ncbi:MAG: N-acetyltransferase [Polyangiaceae bacterium]|nr:N-acetyltransferase [Polyangiaceae bacterium]